jgi:hypothetical protein
MFLQITHQAVADGWFRVFGTPALRYLGFVLLLTPLVGGIRVLALQSRPPQTTEPQIVTQVVEVPRTVVVEVPQTVYVMVPSPASNNPADTAGSAAGVPREGLPLQAAQSGVQSGTASTPDPRTISQDGLIGGRVGPVVPPMTAPGLGPVLLAPPVSAPRQAGSLQSAPSETVGGPPTERPATGSDDGVEALFVVGGDASVANATALATGGVGELVTAAQVEISPLSASTVLTGEPDSDAANEDSPQMVAANVEQDEPEEDSSDHDGSSSKRSSSKKGSDASKKDKASATLASATQPGSNSNSGNARPPLVAAAAHDSTTNQRDEDDDGGKETADKHIEGNSSEAGEGDSDDDSHLKKSSKKDQGVEKQQASDQNQDSHKKQTPKSSKTVSGHEASKPDTDKDQLAGKGKPHKK